MRTLGDYLELTVGEARAQWGQILRRQPRPRQEAFTPVEAVLCYALFFVVDPHKYGGSTRFPPLYNVVLQAARDMGIAPNALPDFLTIEGVHEMDLLGQEELSPRTLATVIEVKAAKQRARLLASEADTMRLVEQAVRLGQHRFANAVLANYQHACAFCGFAPHSIPRNRLLVASHIKPWAVSDDRERLDPSNGVAACPTHDAAFDTGLITVNGGLRATEHQR